MNKAERAALVQVRDDLVAAKEKMPARAEYVKGVANQGAAGVVAKAIADLNNLLVEEAEQPVAENVAD